MMPYTDLTGLAGIALASVVLALRLPIVARLPFKPKVLLAGVLLVVLAMPFGDLSLAEFVRGVTGDLSIPTLLLLILPYVLSPAGGITSDLPACGLSRLASCSHRGLGRGDLLVFIAIAALLLYPFALGIGMFDPYRLGFGDYRLIAGLLLLALGAWWRQYTLLALVISLAVLAWSVGWYESNNLWDYLIDPWVSIYALGVLLKRGVSILAKRSS